MKLNPSIFKVLVSLEVLLLAACSNFPQSSNPKTSLAPERTANSPDSVSSKSADNNHPKTSQGGQVIESGSYHLELVPVFETDGIHFDFFLQTGDNHEAISDAKVTAQVQLPDGEQKALDMEYDAEGKHYAAFLSAQASGEYKVAVQTDRNGEKVNGRFSFSR